MKRRTVQILLALLVIIYRKTWFWWIFNHFSARFVAASREFFQILAFLELSVSLLAILYLLVFEGRRILELKWKWSYPVYLLLAYGVNYFSDTVFSFQFRFNTTRLFHLCKWRSNLSIPLPKNSFSLLSYFAPYHD